MAAIIRGHSSSGLNSDQCSKLFQAISSSKQTYAFFVESNILYGSGVIHFLSIFNPLIPSGNKKVTHF